MWVLLLVVLLVVLSAILKGCKAAPQRIGEQAAAIRQVASSSRERFVAVDDRDGEAEQDRIMSLAEEISVDATLVDPTEPWWSGAVRNAAMALAVVAVVVLLWQTGIAAAIRGMFGLLPRRSVATAKLLSEVVEPNSQTSVREAVAAMRASDPLLDAAYRRVRNAEHH